jgi:hypothetical protein
VKAGVDLQNSNPAVTQELVRIGQKSSQGEALTSDEAALVDQWLSLGLERGMMAEIRAWSQTYLLYEQLRKESLIAPIDWADQILAQQQRNESIPEFCRRYFNALYAHPANGMFVYPYLKDRMEALRVEKLKQFTSQ